MGKKLIVVLIIIAGTFAIIWIDLPYYVLDRIKDYEPYTFEMVLSDTALVNKYAIRGHSKPEDYGFRSEEVNFISLDSTKLNAWYIPAKRPTNRCLIFIHGRTSNRLKPMKYLALIDSLSLDALYNIFIPDLRNSGKSEPASTYMGYKFGEDVTASILLMHKKYDQDTFLLYGFSMGAMAVLNAIGRPELRRMLDDKMLTVEGIILDSPLSDVKETIHDQMDDIGLPMVFFKKVFDMYSSEINDFGEKMKLSVLRDPRIPMLILQSEDDETTKAFVLKDELEAMKNKDNLTVVWFQGPGHVRIFQDHATKGKYIRAIEMFLINSVMKKQ